MRLDEATYDRLASVFRRRHEEDLRRDNREFRAHAPEHRLRLIRWSLTGIIILGIWVTWFTVFSPHCTFSPSYVLLSLRGPDGQAVDVPAVIAMVDGSEAGRPAELHRVDGGRYVLVDFHDIGPVCVSCDYEIRAEGFQPYRFRAGDHCISKVRRGLCSDVELSATLIREIAPTESKR